MATGQQIKNECSVQFAAFPDDCNKFLKAVAATFNIAFDAGDDANKITAKVRGGGWTQLRDDVADPNVTKRKEIKAKELADAGWLVVAGLLGSELSDTSSASAHGHVAIVITGAMTPSGASGGATFPKASWGKLGSIGAHDRSLAYSFTADQLKRVTYSAKKTE